MEIFLELLGFCVVTIALMKDPNFLNQLNLETVLMRLYYVLGCLRIE